MKIKATNVAGDPSSALGVRRFGEIHWLCTMVMPANLAIMASAQFQFRKAAEQACIRVIS
jgi:hypothetical protein